MKIYLDVSCLNRPFDDQTQARVRLESEAVTLILEEIDRGRWQDVSSQMAEMEIAAISDRERRRRVQALLPNHHDRIRLTDEMFGRAEELTRLGFKPADAVHVAAAEAAATDVLLTCDDHFLRAGRRNAPRLAVAVANPLSWLQEHENDANA